MLKMCRRYLSSGCASVSAGQGEGGKCIKRRSIRHAAHATVPLASSLARFVLSDSDDPSPDVSCLIFFSFRVHETRYSPPPHINGGLAHS